MNEREPKEWVALAIRLDAENAELRQRLTRNPELDDEPGVLAGDAKTVADFLAMPKRAPEARHGVGPKKKPRRSK